ncbi:MAG: hypothetical protein R2762_28510 [Bryobacteraceae bacterium]
MNTWIRLASLVAIGALAVAGPIEDGTKMDPKTVDRNAAAARTANEHLDVARQYEALAQSFDAKALRHDEKAEKLAMRRGYNPMAAKWPAIANGPADRERNLAIQARRTAAEARELAARHRGLAAEASAAS